MPRKAIALLPLLFAVGCHHFQRCDNCDRCERRERRASCKRECCEEREACAAPASAPAAAPAAAPMAMAPQAPMMAAPMMGMPMMAPQSQEMTGALTWGKKQITLPTLKMVAVPKPQQAQMVTIQQSPMMMAPQMMAPQMMMSAPAAAPSCPSTDAANLQLLQALMQASHQQNAPAASPSADEAELEARAKKLEQKLDALTKALENGQ